MDIIKNNYVLFISIFNFVNILILKFHDKFSNILNIYDKPDNQIKLHLQM